MVDKCPSAHDRGKQPAVSRVSEATHSFYLLSAVARRSCDQQLQLRLLSADHLWQMLLPQGTAELLSELEDYTPTVPDELTQHYLRRGGYDCKDVKLLRVISIAAQRFVAGVVNDSLQLSKRRRLTSTAKLREQGYNPKDKRLVLTPDDLSVALREYGVNLRSAPYFVDSA